MVEISLHGVTKAYRDPDAGEVAALDALDLVFPDGSVTAVTGPAGCGKTTVLRVIAGLEDIDAGEVRFDGVDVTGASPRERDVALVTQDSAVYPHLTVRQQLAEPLRYRGIGRAESDERVLAEARVLGLERLLDRLPRTLSAGDRQRLALGRALVRRPKAFLLDEPLAAVDAHERTRLRAELARLWQGFATTTVYVTHDTTEAMVLADRIAVLDAGRVLQVDPPQVCYDRPANAQVARFIGGRTMRLVDAEVTDRGLRVGEVVLPIGTAVRESLGARRRVLLGLRASAVRLAEDAAESHRGDSVPVAVSVERAVGAGAELDLEVVLEPGGPNAPRLLTPPPRDQAVRVGDAAIARIDVGACPIFDAVDGAALHFGRGHGSA